jgi:hypothetical protein
MHPRHPTRMSPTLVAPVDAQCVRRVAERSRGWTAAWRPPNWPTPSSSAEDEDETELGRPRLQSQQLDEEFAMSETELGASASKQSSPGSSADSWAANKVEPTRWVGWIMFAGVMLIVLGFFHAFQGFIALFQDDYFQVGKNDLTIHLDYTAWGWTHIILGLAIVVVGVGLLAGQTWARVIGVIIAVVSVMVNAAFLAAYPIWSTIMIAFDILVIWALTVHGREMKAYNDLTLSH